MAICSINEKYCTPTDGCVTETNTYQWKLQLLVTELKKAMVFSMEKKHLQSISAYLGIVNNTNLSFSGLSSPYVSL